MKCNSYSAFMPTVCRFSGREELQLGLVPAAVSGHVVDFSGAVRPRGGASVVSVGQVQSVRALQVGQKQRRRGGRAQPVERDVVRLGRPAQQRHRRGWVF